MVVWTYPSNSWKNRSKRAWVALPVGNPQDRVPILFGGGGRVKQSLVASANSRLRVPHPRTRRTAELRRALDPVLRHLAGDRVAVEAEHAGGVAEIAFAALERAR